MSWPTVRIDERLQIRDLSPEATALLHTTRAQALGCAVAMALGVVDSVAFDAWARSGWLGQHERVWRLQVGVHLSVRVVPVADGWQLLLVDVTALTALADAHCGRGAAGAVSGLANAVCQELNDPMSIVQGRLELIDAIGLEDPDRVARHLSVALSHARRVSGSLHNLRLVGRGPSEGGAPVPLAQALQNAVDLVGPRASAIYVDVVPEDLSAGADQALISRVTVNLIRAALAVNGARAGVVVKARRSDAAQVRITVSTRAGRAIAESAALAIDRTLLWGAGGQLEVHSVGGFTHWSLTLPAPARRLVRRHKPSGRLLVVGADAFVGSIRDLLDRDGLQIVPADDVIMALTHLRADQDFSGVLTELELPGCSGLTLWNQIARHFPALLERTLIASDVHIERGPAAARWLPKPVSRVTLLRGLGRRAR